MSAFKDVLASIVGSTACVYTGQPFDTVKVRMQVQPGEFKGTIDCFRKAFKGEGITALWKGSLPALTGALSENAMAFGVNGLLKRYFFQQPDVNENKLFHYLHPFINGGITGAFTAVVLCPCDVVKCRAQLSRARGINASVKDIVTALYNRQGIRGLYTGFAAQVMRDIPFYASFFGVYGVCCQYLKASTNWSDTSVYFVSGGFAGQVAWAVSIAPDTVKSRIQTSIAPQGIVTTAKEILKAQGIRGFFTGIEVAIFRAFPANAALFVGYELSRELMG